MSGKERETTKKKASPDPELRVMSQCLRALEALPLISRKRIVNYLESRITLSYDLTKAADANEQLDILQVSGA